MHVIRICPAGLSPGPARFLAGLLVGLLAASLVQPARAQLPAARLSTIFPPGGSVGTSVDVDIGGSDLDAPNRLAFSHPGITATSLDGLRYKIAIASNVPPGTYDVRFAGRFGLSNPRRFLVSAAPDSIAPATNTSQASACEVSLNRAYHGRVAARTYAWFRFSAKKAQRILIECLAESIDSRLDPSLALLDANGREWERSRTSAPLDFVAPADGTYFVRLTDFLYRGGDDYFYRLTLSTGPHVDFVLPVTAVAGAKNEFTLYGRNLPGGKPVKGLTIGGKPLEQLAVGVNLPGPREDLTASTLPASAELDSFAYRFKWANPVLLSLVPTGAVAVLEQEPNTKPDQAQKITPPCEISGQFHPATDVDRYLFTAKKGDVYWLEVVSQRLGLPTSPHLLVQRVTRNDKGDESTTEILDLSDRDMNLGEREFNTASRDPVGRFEAKEDGTYRVEVRDLFGSIVASPASTYRLSIRRPNPDFRLVAQTLAPKYKGDAKNIEFSIPVLRRGETLPVRVMAFRRDGFAGDIALSLVQPPPGLSLASDLIESGKSTDFVLLTAAADAPAYAGPIHLVGRARIDERDVQREARGGTLVFPVGNVDTERPEARVIARFELAVTDQESAPIAITPTEPRTYEGSAKASLEIPLTITRRGEFNANLKLKPLGPGTPDALKEFDVDGKATNATLKLDLAALKLAPGRYTFAVQTITTGKYRNNPEAAAFAEATAREAEKNAADLAADDKKAGETLDQSRKDLATADAAVKAAADKLAAAKAALEKSPADEALKAAVETATSAHQTALSAGQAAAKSRDSAEKARADADAKAKAAVARKESTANLAKAATEKAKPRDVSYQLTSAPIVVQINPAQVAEAKETKSAAK